MMATILYLFLVFSFLGFAESTLDSHGLLPADDVSKYVLETLRKLNDDVSELSRELRSIRREVKHLHAALIDLTEDLPSPLCTADSNENRRRTKGELRVSLISVFYLCRCSRESTREVSSSSSSRHQELVLQRCALPHVLQCRCRPLQEFRSIPGVH
jgi:hypothetical protein